MARLSIYHVDYTVDGRSGCVGVCCYGKTEAAAYAAQRLADEGWANFSVGAPVRVSSNNAQWDAECVLIYT